MKSKGKVVGLFMLTALLLLEGCGKQKEQIVKADPKPAEPVTQEHWTLDEKGFCYYNEQGQTCPDSWQDVDGYRYHFDQDGYMQTGWVEDQGKYYYCNPAGVYQTGWLAKQDKWYYLNQDGIMQTAWGDVDGKRYYFGSDGAMKTGWIQDEAGWFYMEKDGTVHGQGFLPLDDGTYYLGESGAMQTGWLTVEGKTYYLQDSGRMLCSADTIDGKQYVFGSDGVMQTGWISRNSCWYYYGDDGAMQTGWITEGDKKYYLDKSGMMRKGWIAIDGTSYYFNGNGVYIPDASFAVDHDGPMVAITFDDGPGIYTDRLLSALEANHVKATFFMLGNLTVQYPDAVRRMKSLGCQIGNHTYDHTTLTHLDAAGIQDEIAKTNANLSSIIGEGATVMRPPGGGINDTVKANVGLPIILWSIDTLDWKTKDTQNTVNVILDQVSDGSVILMHDIYGTTVDAAEQVIPELIKRGYQLVTVSELAAAKGKTLEVGTVYGSIR